MYDVLIVGAGIAGLHCARRLLAAHPNYKIIILEKYNYAGGRITTFKGVVGGRQYKWENGAGRIHKSHTLVRAYIKRYGLTTKPSPDTIKLQLSDGAPIISNPFHDMAKSVLGPLTLLGSSYLASKTLKEILAETYGPRSREFISLFPYKSEIDTLRADVALDSFLGPAALQGGGYETCTEGLGSLVAALTDEVIGLGATILYGHEAVSFDNTTLTVMANGSKRSFQADKIIFATHVAALKKIGGFQGWPMLKQVAMRPLLRIYAVFPMKNGKSWFGPERIVFAKNPLRYFIPVGPNVAMVSYTDGSDVRPWINVQQLQEKIMGALRRAFPRTRVPEPLFIKAHPWYEGCSYWLPTKKYIPAEELSVAATNPFPNIYVCGESFSTNQAWMEGALEHAELLLRLHFHVAK